MTEQSSTHVYADGRLIPPGGHPVEVSEALAYERRWADRRARVWAIIRIVRSLAGEFRTKRS